MERWSGISVLLVCCLLLVILGLHSVNAARQNPLKNPKICGRPVCDPSTSKFGYGDSKRYKYDYVVNLRTEFAGTGENTSDIFLKATVDLIFPKNCEGVLSLSDVKLWEQDDSMENLTDTSEATDKKADDTTYDYYGYVASKDYDDSGATGAGSSANSADDDLDLSHLHPKSRDMATDLQKFDLRFAFHDGLVSEVCPTVDEPSWVLNFKKGVLSAIQNTMMRFDVDLNTTETDVSGQCNVAYSLEQTNDVFIIIRKSKDIASCRHRYSTHSILQTTPYAFREDKAIWPILNSQSYCNMTIDHNIYREVSCVERHQLIPFSNNNTGAVTTLKSQLILKAEENYNSGDFFAYEDEHQIQRRSPLIFDHTPPTKPTHGEIKASRDLLKQMCHVGFPNIQREFIDVFTNFLHTSKHLDYKALTQLLARSESICSNGKNHVLESLPYIGSTASYQLMRDQIVANVISKMLAHNWMTSLSFIQRPDEETLETFYTILEFSRKKIDPEYTLGASAVIHSFCRHNPDCSTHAKVERIIRLLETEFLNLFNMFKTERRTRERLTVILKGLGNIGVMSEQFAEQLQEIITEDIAPVDIRLNSVLAFRRVDCIKYRKFFLDVYGNFSINSEIRIFSYIQTMRCPDHNTIIAIKAVLEAEQINQVGSYVWSHLKNVAKSSSPVRVEAQGLLINDDLSDKFKMDIRKFSRNYEHSLFFDEFNFGSSTDMNLIYGTDSYLPRMATLNFTADLFGQSVNFFEISARAEGFEELAASIFGPKGPLNRDVFRRKLSFLNRWIGDESSEDDDTIANFLSIDALRVKRNASNASISQSLNQKDEEVSEFIDNPHYRSSRSINESEQRKSSLQKDVDDLGYKLKYNYNNPRATIGLRVFGNDMRYYTLEGMLEVMSAAKEFDPFHQAAKILSGKEVVYTKSRVFMDASYSVPLSIGVPLSINAFGASSVDLRLSGNLERMESLSDWHFDVGGKFKPSVSVDVITTMQSDIFYAVSGIRIKSNLYSSSAVEAKLKVRGANLVSFTFSLPQDKNEILSARSELIVMKESEEISQPGIDRRRSNTTCTWPLLDQAIGLKMCSSFSVPDLSNATDVAYPGLLLSGPMNLSLVLEKSDLTAKKFVFEYEWQQQKNNSNWSFVFHTPDSAIKRLLTANVSTVPDAFNASVWFINGRNTYSAGGTYKGNPDDRRLDVFLDTNGRKNLNFNMEMSRVQERTAWVYRPKALLSVNGENITGLIGTVRINEKNGLIQNDVELTFETKRLQALVRGNIIQSEITTSTNLTVNYRFQANKIETINLEGKLTNTGDKSKTEYRGNVKLKTSAYPKLNFASNATWLSLQGHTEGVITYNNAPDFIDPNYTSAVRLVFARSHSDEVVWEGSRTRASLEVKVPKSNVDFRILVKHEERNKNGTEHNVILGLRYSPQKEATGLFSVHLPRRNLFAVDAYMNVTVPDFDSCTVRLRLTEKAEKDYMINFNGSWFSGHSIAVKGNYKDKSSRIQLLHHLKLIVESPSFEVTTFNMIYRRNQLLIFADIQAKYNKDPYGLTVQYASGEDKKKANAELKLKIKDRDYWMLAKLLSEQPKLLQVEIHLDKLRDIHLKIGGLAVEQRKEVSVEIKWDANRDPSQRLALMAEYNTPGNRLYDATVMITYPDRTISCGFNAYTGGPTYNGTARATWSPNDAVVFSYNTGFIQGAQFNNWVRAKLETPFDGWRHNHLKAGFYSMNNLILANSSFLWADNQKLELGYKSDYEIAGPILSFDVRLGINSSVRDIPTISAKVKHWQNSQKIDTDIDLRYNGSNDTMNIYSMKSIWEMIHTNHFRNISGSVLMISPFEGYRKGGLATKFSLSDNRTIRGAASLNYDIREFTLAMDGYVKKFTDNMLTVNITTPLEKFRTIKGRFGLSEKKRHAVAEVRAPTVALGAEALCDITSLMDFDVRLSLATPIESFKQAALFAKIKSHTVDLRGSWNNATLGFTGVWYMNNITNFEYSYRVFTPLQNFEENGFIVKFVRKDIFVVEVHGKLSTYKLGVRINGKPKSKLLNQLGGNKLELELLYDDDLQPPEPTDDDEYYDENDIDFDEFFTYYLDFELDTLVWPTMNGMVDIQEIRDFYIIVGNAQLPQGRVDLKNRVYFPDLLHIKNVLNLQTPFIGANDVKSIFEYHVDLDRFFIEEFEIVINNGIEPPAELGFKLNYTKVLHELKPKQHNIALMLRTPFEILDRIDITGFFELEENIFKGNITSVTSATYLTLGASVETEEDFLETSVGLLLNTSVIPHYGCRVYFKKDFSNVDNFVDIQLEVTDNETMNKLLIDASWHLDSFHYVNGRGRFQTTMLPLRLAESSILMTKGPNPVMNFDMAVTSDNGQRIECGTRASKKKDIFNVEIWTPMRNFRNISMHGSLLRSKSNPNDYTVSGELYRNRAVYAINGVITVDYDYPAETRLRIQPKAGGPDGVIELNIMERDTKAWDFRFSAIEDGKMCQISGGYAISDDGLDFSVLVQSTEPDISRISVSGKITPESRNHVRGEFTMVTPWKHLGIESVRLQSEVEVQRESGKVQGEFHIGKVLGRGSCLWSWLLAENMQLMLESYIEQPKIRPRNVHLSAKYLNPNKSFQRMMTSGKLNVDNKWNLEVNGTVAYLSAKDVQAGLVAKLPPPIGDTHHLAVRYRGNLLTKEPPNVFVEGKYESQEAKRKFLSRISYRNVDDLQGLGRVEWGQADDIDAVEGDFQVLRKYQVRKEFYAKLITPIHRAQDTFFLKGHYDKNADQYHQFVCSVDLPDARRLAEVDIEMESISNMHGFVYSMTPFHNATWLRTEFNFSSLRGETLRYLQGTWPTDSAFLKLQSNYIWQGTERDLQGTIQMEVPLTSRHRADIKYGHKLGENLDKGHFNVIYNDKQVLDGQYKRSEQHPSKSLWLEVIDITLENEFKPLGVHYVNSRDISHSLNSSLDVRHVEVFELRRETTFNITGELHSHAIAKGRKYKIVAIHPNRTVILSTEYEDADERVTKQRTKLELSPTAWIGYNIEVGNYSSMANESQNFILELFYPKRSLSTEGWYYITEDRFDSDIALKWTTGPNTEERKTVRAGLLWQSEPLDTGDRDNQSVVVTIGHPYLEKDVTFKGSYYRGLMDILKTNLIIDYSEDPEHLVELRTSLRDLSSMLGHTNYTFSVFAQHKASDLDVNVQGTAAARPSYYKTESHAFYKRGYFPVKNGMFLTKLDLNRKEFEYERKSPYRAVRFWALPYAHYPVYGVNATVWDSPDMNNTGFFYVDLERMFTRMEVNLTEDDSQNLQMVGYIPDARSGYLEIWRNYEEIRIIDVSSYFKMNHSRLITGRFHWRPKIRDEIKDKIRAVGTSFYNSFSDGIDFWIKSLYSETIESIDEVWGTAKIHTQSFLDDVGELSVLEEDLEDLRLFVNQSYEANDFYIKTVVNFTLTILDELAIRDHIESLPKIFSEIWQAMGDSGKALRKSIVWLIEMVKTSYNTMLDAISRFFHGESLYYFSDLMGKAVEKYDKFVKDLHISFIKYVQNLWNKFWGMMSNYWRSVLKRIEPHIFRFFHYIESAAWNISKEVFDFIYKRTNELAESPYFNKVSSFTQDMDRLYKDIKSHDALTNLKKYSLIAWNFLKEKYFKLVPFGAELNEVITEIWEEIKSLEKLEHVQVIIQKYNEIEATMMWIAEELQVETRLHQLYALLRNKLRNYAMNALETADMYREAKTKFIFDPEVGVVDLEQKLPMSWHAFNETPKFEEIPEYKLLASVQDFFSTTNSSLVKSLYSLRSHLDPKTWLPPYYARSLLIGSRHYMTFDKRFVGLNLQFAEMSDQRRNTQCSYLMAHDFFQRNFTLLLEPSTTMDRRNLISTRKLTLIANGQLIEIDLGKDTLSIGGNSAPMLPVKIGDVTVYRDLDILTIHSETAFALNCNVQFDLCWFEISGWYFGQTAGILGTMNNEHFDEFMTSKSYVPSSEEEFTDSWGLKRCKQKKTTSVNPVRVIGGGGGGGDTMCDQFFKSGIFSACADTIDVKSFLEMCFDLEVNSNPISTGYPIQKGPCTVALAYIEACTAAKIPLRVPDQCVHCQLSNGSYVPEGTFITIKNQQVPRSSDVVFIVEAKPCNANLTANKNIMSVVSTLEEQLVAAKITQNRYAVVSFGGRPPFDKPRSIIHQNRVFASNFNELHNYFDHIEAANGTNNDILQAISVASKLSFRPGVSKTFILLTCSDCAARHMKFDYTSILQFMLEEGVNLHILADVEFDFEKSRKLRHFFGLDRDVVYSKRFPEGDAETRKQLHVPKENLGICTPLALETNGSVFSARKLMPERKNPIKRFATIFAKRVTKSAAPNPCQICECTGHNTGIAYMACAPCARPSSSAMDDYDFQFNDWEWEDDEDEEELDA